MTPWRLRPVSELCSHIIDCVNKTAPTSSTPTQFKMLRTTNVRNGWIDTDSVRFVNEAVFKRWTRRMRPQRGDVVLTREAPLGEVGIIRTDDQVFLGQRLVMYRVDPTECDTHFLLYSMLGPIVQAELRSLGSGATVEHLRVPDCERLAIPCPPLPIQRRIGAVLRSFDDLIENNRRRIEVLEEMARAIYREWFVDFRFPGHETSTLVDSPFGSIPSGWAPARLGHIVAVDRTGVQPARSPDDMFDHYSIPAFDEGQLPTTEAGSAIKSGKFLVSSPAVLVSKLNPRIERTWLVHPATPRRSVASTEFLVFRPSGQLSLDWIYLMIQSEPFQARLRALSGGTSTSHQRVKPDDLLAIELLRPAPDVVAKFTAVVSPQLAMARVLRTEGRQINALRDALLPKLVTGQLDVSSLDLGALVEPSVA